MIETADPRAADPLFTGLILYTDLPGRLGMTRQVLERLARKDPARFPRRVRIGRKAFVSEEAVRRWLLGQFEVSAA